jgi:hypothetical protein
MTKETGESSAGIEGDKLYQKRARKALPLLARQALSGAPIFYEELANELAMPNPRNLNYVLGSVGQSLIELGVQWNESIPPIQCLVISQTNGLPGQGFGWFMPDKDKWKSLTKREKAVLVKAVMQQIYSYPRWLEVLRALGLEPIRVDYLDLLAKASKFASGGEGPEHKKLKEFVRLRPYLVGVARRFGPGQSEKPIPSGDKLDVFFETDQECVAVEVKSSISDVADIVRGIFQCVKYAAVLNAMSVASQAGKGARAVLVLQGTLPSQLRDLRVMLGVEVVESVLPSS